MGAMVNVNGHIVDEEHARVSVFDHGFLFGEGIYETLRTYNGEPFLFERHMRIWRNAPSEYSAGGGTTAATASSWRGRSYSVAST